MIDKALEMDPNSAEAFAALGLARSHLKQNDAAESALRHAIDLNPSYVPAQLWLSTVLESQGRYPEQQLVLQKAMELDPLNELLAVNYAKNLSTRGEAEHARQLLNELIAFRPDSTILLRSLASQELLHGNLVEGFRLALRSHNLQPEDPSDIGTLAQAWLNLGAPEEAEQVLAKGLEIHPNNLQLQNVYWQVLLATDRTEEAKAMAQQWLSNAGEDAPPFMAAMYNTQMGMLTFKEGDLPAATRYFTAALQENNSGKYDNFQIFVVTMAAMANRMYGDVEEADRLLQAAQRDLQRARVNGVDNPDINYTESVVLAMSDQLDASVAKLQEAYDGGFRFIWLLQIDPRIDPIRDHPEFIAIRANMTREVETALEEVRLLALASI
jgi:tetratricopeptide (TPR) repeat protein